MFVVRVCAVLLLLGFSVVQGKKAQAKVSLHLWRWHTGDDDAAVPVGWPRTGDKELLWSTKCGCFS